MLTVMTKRQVADEVIGAAKKYKELWLITLFAASVWLGIVKGLAAITDLPEIVQSHEARIQALEGVGDLSGIVTGHGIRIDALERADTASRRAADEISRKLNNIECWVQHLAGEAGYTPYRCGLNRSQ